MFTRRTFLASGLATTFGAADALYRVGQAAAADGPLLPDAVRFSDDIEPLVRLIEDTPRDKAVETLAVKLRDGLPYNQFVAALFLAGIRNVNPQPPGFKFHCVYMIHSCNYLANTAPPEERLLPMFYVLDDFKRSQEEDIKLGDFVLRQREGELPSGAAAWSELDAAMEAWDEDRADRAITGLTREVDIDSIFARLWEYGARDYRNIGHKIIYVSNAWRTLETIGRQHAGPVLRSIILGLLDFGKDEVVNNYGYSDQCYHANKRLADEAMGRMPDAWDGNTPNAAATEALIADIRSGNFAELCPAVVKRLQDGGCQAHAVWDALHLAACELMIGSPGVVGAHPVTSVNAMRFAFNTAKEPRTKLLLLLQGVGWTCQFRNFLPPKNAASGPILALEAETIGEDADAACASVFDAIGPDTARASRLALAFTQRHGAPRFIDTARRLVFTKSTEHHMYKWPAAIFEDARLVTPEYLPRMLAASVYYIPGSDRRDTPVIQRAIEAMSAPKPA
ncbi:MAG: hypothetical protein AAB353_05850 [Candidatus Hydrogenedentota bacterium]